MKRQNLQLLIVAFLLSGLINSQANAQSIMVGAKAGLNYSSVAKDYLDTYDFRTGNNYGLFGEISLPDLPVSFTIEAQYATFGSNNIDPDLIYYENSPLLNIPGEGEITNSHIDFTGIEIPVMVNFNLPVETLNPKIYAGASYNYLLASYNTNEFQSGSKSKAEVTERISSYDYGALLGVGGHIDVAMIAITYDVRYRMGFADLNNVQYKPTFTSHSWQAMVGIGYRFGSGE